VRRPEDGIMDPFDDLEKKPTQTLTPTMLFRIFLRRKWLFLVPSILCMGMAYGVIKKMEPIYQAGGQLRVHTDGVRSQTIEETQGRGTSIRDLDRETIALIEGTALSPAFLLQLVESLDPRYKAAMAGKNQVGVPDSKYLARRLERMVSVSYDGRHIFGINVRHRNPTVAYKLATEVMARFMEEEKTSRLSRNENTRQFLRNQRPVYEQNLLDARRRLTEFQSTMMTSQVSGSLINEQNIETAEILLSRYQTQDAPAEASDLINLENMLPVLLREQTSAIDSALAADDIEEMRLTLDAMEYDQLVSMLEGPDSEAGSANIGSKRLELYYLLEQQSAASHPHLRPVELTNLVQYLYARVYQQINASVYARLSNDVNVYRQFMTMQPEQSSTLAGLQQQVVVAQELLNGIDQDIRRQDIAIAAGLSDVDHRIVLYRETEMPRFPVEPDKKRLAMMGVILSIGIGVGLVILSELFDRSFKTVQEIESHLELPVFGALPLVGEMNAKGKAPRHLKFWLIVIASITAFSAFVFFWLYPRLMA
jgi:protein tyrosine kinase modulator